MMRSNNQLGPPPFFSVVINCRNSERFLTDCLNSVSRQSFRDFEVIVWNNASTDKTGQIAESFEEKDSRFRLFHSVHDLKLGEARNLAIEQSRGDFIAFLDSDDLWDPIFLHEHAEILGQTSAKIFGIGNVQVIDSKFELGQIEMMNSKSVPELPPKSIFPRLLRGNVVYFSSLVMPRSFFSANSGFHPNYVQAEDYEILLRLSQQMKCYKAGQAFYRIHQDNATNRQEENLYLEEIEILQLYRSKFWACFSLYLAAGNYFLFLKGIPFKHRTSKVRKTDLNLGEIYLGVLMALTVRFRMEIRGRLAK
jgi:glycosyltransferase involved in cell wall biosynthesis